MYYRRRIVPGEHMLFILFLVITFVIAGSNVHNSNVTYVTLLAVRLTEHRVNVIKLMKLRITNLDRVSAMVSFIKNLIIFTKFVIGHISNK